MTQNKNRLEDESPNDELPQQSSWGEFIRSIQLDGLSLVSLNAEREPVVGGDRLTPEFEFQSTLREWMGNEGYFVVDFAGSFVGRHSETKAEACSISMKFILVYYHPTLNTYSRALAEQFAEVNAPFHVWPFVREKLYSITMDMTLPYYHLPPLIIGPASERATGVVKRSDRLQKVEDRQN